MKEIQFNGHAVELHRSSRRKTVGLSITADGRIRVAAPSGLPDDRIAEFLGQKEAWLQRHLQEREEAWSRIREGVAFFLGKTYQLEWLAGDGSVQLGRDRILVPSLEPWRSLKHWYRQQAQQLISQRVQEHAGRLRLEVEEVGIKEWRRHWGECRRGGVLRFNWRLVLLPTEVLDYVVVHEVVHLLEAKHTRRFWRFMGSVMPGYVAQREWLKRYGTPLLLWEAR